MTPNMLNMIEHGQADGVPLLIAHGLYGSARNWSVIARRLSDTRRVVCVDMRNHGHSPRMDTHDYPAMAEDLAEVIDHLGGKADVLGHSMGGKTSMVLALTRPDAIRRLIVADIAPVTYGHSQLEIAQAMMDVDLSQVSRRSEAGAQLAALGVAEHLHSFLTQSLDLKERRWLLNLPVLHREMPSIMSFPEIRSSWDGPTLFLTGALSDYVLPEHRPVIRSFFPKARFARINGANHWLHADKPREFEASVRAYLDA